MSVVGKWDTTDLENLMGDLKEDIIKMAISDVPETFTQEDTIQIDSTDDRLNYLFVKQDDVENKIFTPKEYISREVIDYDVVVEKGKKETEESLGTLDKTVPASFFQVKSIEEGIEYYMTKNPDLPEGVAEIMARYTFGNKQVKEDDKQKKSKKKKKVVDKLEVKHGKFVVDFS